MLDIMRPDAAKEEMACRSETQRWIACKPQRVQGFRDRKSDHKHSAEHDHHKTDRLFGPSVHKGAGRNAGSPALDDAENGARRENPENKRDVGWAHIRLRCQPYLGSVSLILTEGRARCILKPASCYEPYRTRPRSLGRGA